MSLIDSRVVSIDGLKLEHFAKGDKFEANSVRIGPLVGAKDLGYSYDVVPPGKCSCPFHSHRGEEEMFFIVRGEGTLRYGNETKKIRAGDVICCPTGGPETAHQIVNDSEGDLAYLSVSTMLPAEVCEYPDSRKIGAFGGGLRHMTRADQELDYGTGEICTRWAWPGRPRCNLPRATFGPVVDGSRLSTISGDKCKENSQGPASAPRLI